MQAPPWWPCCPDWAGKTVNTMTGAFALLSLIAIIFGTSADAKRSPFLTFACIAVFVALTVVVSAAGHAFILTVQKWATWIFGALTLLVAIYLATTVDWSSFIGNAPGSASAFLIGVGTIAAGTGIGWVNSGADMARYQKTSVKSGSLILTAAAGAGIPPGRGYRPGIGPDSRQLHHCLRR